MINRFIDASRALISPRPVQRMKRLDAARNYQGHTHFWERALSRRRMLQAAGAAAGLLGAGQWTKAHAAVPGDFPKPIPGGFTRAIPRSPGNGIG
ncbi:MAG: twin-arginine translocation signal domain-containing protein [Acidobacteria bacterium]|nr:twin-arginine translocation signal domain-containing protein [Acidobacteriota bacterium]